MYTKLKYSFWVLSLLSCYPLYALGQILLFIGKQQEEDFYTRLTTYSSAWVTAHILLMAGIMLMIPAYLAICHYVKNAPFAFLAELSTVLISLSTFVLFGQYVIDLSLVAVFRLPPDKAYEISDKIQSDPLLQALFYDNSRMLPFLKYADLTFLSQIFLGIAFVVSKKVPKWALLLFFIAIVLTQFGILIHPVYGRIIKRLSYSLISISFLPIAIDLSSSKIFTRRTHTD